MFPGKKLAHAAGPVPYRNKPAPSPQTTSDRVWGWVIFVFFVALLALIVWLASMSPAPENGIPYWNYPM